MIAVAGEQEGDRIAPLIDAEREAILGEVHLREPSLQPRATSSCRFVLEKGLPLGFDRHRHDRIGPHGMRGGRGHIGDRCDEGRPA